MLGEEGNKRLFAKLGRFIKPLDKLKEVVLLHQIIKTFLIFLNIHFLLIL